jgi:diguanylate cyclase (GGDEF)-like protein/PAS domain S-box-containing protein
MRQGTDSNDEYLRYKFAVENIKDVLWEVDKNLRFTFVSPAVYDMTGYFPDEILGRSILELLASESSQSIQNRWNEMFQDGWEKRAHDPVLYDVEFICKDASLLWCEVCVKPVFKQDGQITFVGTTRDISDKKALERQLREYLRELERKNEQLENLANLDMLTGAYNRRQYDHFISIEIEKYEVYGTPFSMIMFDIDNFKEINDGIGHKKGDSILQEMTLLIRRTLRNTDHLFRWGGDEFIVLLPGLDLQHALTVAHKIKSAAEGYDFETGGRRVTLSLGVGSFNPSEKQDQFIHRVDNAMLRAKSKGKNGVELA